MKTLFIVRGLPGSGKSYKTQQMHKQDLENGISSIVLSTDNLITVGGQYLWSRESCAAGHKLLHELFKVAINKCDHIYIDNTNIKLKDFEEYIKIGTNNNYSIEYVYSDTWWAWDVIECFYRNSHGVPFSTICSMAFAYENIK